MNRGGNKKQHRFDCCAYERQGQEAYEVLSYCLHNKYLSLYPGSSLEVPANPVGSETLTGLELLAKCNCASCVERSHLSGCFALLRVLQL